MKITHTFDFLCSKRIFIQKELALLNRWMIFVFQEENYLDFIARTTNQLTENRASKTLFDLHIHLMTCYERSRPTFYFDLIDAIEQGLHTYHEQELIILGFIHWTDDVRSTILGLTEKVILHSPFPRDIWVRMSSVRKIIRPGGRVIICE